MDSNYHINRRQRLTTFACLNVLNFVASIYVFISYFGSCLSYYYFQLMLSVDMFLLLLVFLSQICQISPSSRYFSRHEYLYWLYIRIDSYNCGYYFSYDDRNADMFELNMPLRFLPVQCQRLRVYISNIQDVCRSSTATTFAVCACIFSFGYSSTLLQHRQHFLMRNAEFGMRNSW